MVTTTDTDALTERIAGKLCDPSRHVAHWPLVGIDAYCGQCYTLAERVLPIVAAEVRKVKAEALDEFAAWAESLNDKHPRFKAANDLAADMAKRFKADNYETGDSDERR